MAAVNPTVAIVEDHPLFRHTLAELVRSDPGLELAGMFASGEEVIAGLNDDHPSVLVLDLGLPGMDGRELLRELARRGCTTRCLVLSGSVAPEIVYEVVELGAAGVLSKHAERAEVLDAVRAVAAGGTVLGLDVQGGLAGQIRRRGRRDDGPVLSERETAILSGAARGLTNEEIGRMLHLSPATIKSHLRHVFDKLGATDRASAVAEGMRRGLIG